MNHTLARTKQWFAAAVPQPKLQNFNAQLGVHYEEVGESLEVLEGNDIITTRLIADAQAAISALGEHLKNNSSQELVTITSPVLFLDAFCDQVVTATGVCHMAGYDIVGAMNEVNASNYSKFDEQGQPIFNENKKVMKGPNYFKPDLSRFLIPATDE